MELFIQIEPMGAVRMTQKGKFISKSAIRYLNYKNFIKWQAKQQGKGKVFEKEPLDVHIKFIMPVPESWSRKKQAAAYGRYHMKKPDTDNLVKGVFDSLNKIVWKDDNQVAKLSAVKVYGECPGIEVMIKGLSEDGHEADKDSDT